MSKFKELGASQSSLISKSRRKSDPNRGSNLAINFGFDRNGSFDRSIYDILSTSFGKIGIKLKTATEDKL